MDVKNIADAAKSVKDAGNVAKNVNPSNASLSNIPQSEGKKDVLSKMGAIPPTDGNLTGKDLQALESSVGKEALGSLAQAHGIPKPLVDKGMEVLSPVINKGIGKSPVVKGANNLAAKALNNTPGAKQVIKGASNIARSDKVNKSLVKEEQKEALEKQQKELENGEDIPTESSGILDDIGNFIKNNPGIIVTISLILVLIVLPVLFVLLIASAVMYVVGEVSNVVQVNNNIGQIIWNGITLNGWRTDQNVYLFNIEETANNYLKNVDKSTVDVEKIRYYVNTTTFYSNVVNPDILDDLANQSDNNTTDKKPENIENIEDLTSTFIGSLDELKNKFGSVKNDPKELIANMFECGVYEGTTLIENQSCTSPSLDNEKWYFSEEKYEKYLYEVYVPNKFINCSGCGFETSTELEKENARTKIVNEIMSQAASFYKSYNANDQSNYNAYNISVSGITVLDLEGNVIGLFSLSEYVETIVQRDAASYNDEIKKAYTLTVISELLSRSYNGEITEDNFDVEKIDDSTKKAVKEVLDLKIMKDGKVYYNSFDFGKAQTVQPQKYEFILKALFGDDIEIEKSISNGLQLDPVTGFYMRVEAPDKNDINYYGDNKIGLIGECAWYATNRAREITKTLGVHEWRGSANGNSFCYTADAKKFKTCWPSRGETCAPKQGSIISWGYGTGSYTQWGHVAIIEQVNSNGVIIGDSATKRGSSGYDAGTIPHNLRYENCTSNPKMPCVTPRKERTINWLSDIGNNSYIVCYIYLTEPLEVE